MERLNGEVTLIQISKPKSRPENVQNPPVFEAAYIESTSGPLKFQCPVCSKRFETKTQVENHVNSHVKVISKPSDTNDTTDYAHSSEIDSSLKDPLPHKCEVCFKGFRSPYHLSRHFRTHTKVSDSNSESSSYSCAVCSDSFIDKHEFVLHMKIHMNLKRRIGEDTEIIYKSKLNSEDSVLNSDDASSKNAVDYEINKVSNKNKSSSSSSTSGSTSLQLFFCNQCLNSFKTIQALRNHEKTHKFKCTICINKYFDSEDELENHNLNAHKQSQVKVENSLLSQDFEIISLPKKKRMSTEPSVEPNQMEELYACEFCEKQCKTVQALKNHEKIHQQYEEYSPKSKKVKQESLEYEQFLQTPSSLACDICDKVFKNHTALGSHRKIHRDAEYLMIHSCDICFKVFKTKCALTSHVKSHQTKCSYCQEYFESEALLRLHEEQEHDIVRKDEVSQKSQEEKTCDTCFKVFKNKGALMSHIKTHQVRCDHCSKYFESEATLKLHEYNEHFLVIKNKIAPDIDKTNKTTSTKNKPTCEVCSKEFKAGSALRSHIASSHITCQHCPRYFESDATLKLHEYSDHVGDKRKKSTPQGSAPEPKDNSVIIYCTVCLKEFVNRGALKKHEKIHKVQCKQCLKHFESEQVLRIHEVCKHSTDFNSDEITIEDLTQVTIKEEDEVDVKPDIKQLSLAEKRPQCPVCQKRFKTRSAMISHTKIHENIKKPELKIVLDHIKVEKSDGGKKPKVSIKSKGFTCQICSRTFSNVGGYISHKRSHKVQCKVCLQQFKKKSALIRHSSIHTNTCDVCNKQCTSEKALRFHKKKQHPEKPVQEVKPIQETKTKQDIVKPRQESKIVHDAKTKQNHPRPRQGTKTKEEIKSKTEMKVKEEIKSKSGIKVKPETKTTRDDTKSKQTTTRRDTKVKLVTNSEPVKRLKCSDTKSKQTTVVAKVAPLIIKREKIEPQPKEKIKPERKEKIETEPKSNFVFSCKVCPLKFKKKLLYESHQQSHKPKCHKCSKVFINRGLLKLHLKNDHNILAFPEVPEELSKKKKNKQPKQTIVIDPKTCKVCGKRFKKPSAVVAHEKTHKPKCIQCMETFETQAEFKLHEEKMHINFKKIEPTPEDLLEQILKKEDTTLDQNQSDSSSQFFCNICLRVFRSKSALTSHEKQHENDTIDSDVLSLDDEEDDLVINSCIMCLKVFKTRSALISHLKVHQNTDSITIDTEEPVPVTSDNLSLSQDTTNNTCDTCYKVCKSRQALVNHLKCHQVKCRKCGRYFENKDFLKVHQNEDHQKEEEVPEIKIEPDEILDMVHSCTTCFKTFKSKGSLASHLRNNHVKCTKCGTEFSIKELLDLHFTECRPGVVEEPPPPDEVINVVEEKIIEQPERVPTPKPKVLHNCEICHKDFQTNAALASHKRSHQKRCKNCPKIFENKKLLREHMKTEHPEELLKARKKEPKPKNEIKGFICLSCDKYFKTKQELEHHKASHSEERNFICKICNKGFKIKKQLIAHKATVHEGERIFKCTDCPKDFKLKQQLENHIRSKHREDRPFCCLTCGGRFKFKQALQNHEKIHEEIKDFECVVCQKKFKLKQQLQTHSLTHINIRPFGCELCPRSFKLKQQLDNHVLAVHLNDRPFECEICQKRFQFKQQLIVHRKIHFDTKEFQCELCLKSFTTKQNLDTHMKVHIDFKIFECDVCQTRFVTKQQRDVHRIAKHGEENSWLSKFEGLGNVKAEEAHLKDENKPKSIEETIQGIQDEMIKRFTECGDQDSGINFESTGSVPENLSVTSNTTQENTSTASVGTGDVESASSSENAGVVTAPLEDDVPMEHITNTKEVPIIAQTSEDHQELGLAVQNNTIDSIITDDKDGNTVKNLGEAVSENTGPFNGNEIQAVEASIDDNLDQPALGLNENVQTVEDAQNLREPDVYMEQNLDSIPPDADNLEDGQNLHEPEVYTEQHQHNVQPDGHSPEGSENSREPEVYTEQNLENSPPDADNLKESYDVNLGNSLAPGSSNLKDIYDVTLEPDTNNLKETSVLTTIPHDYVSDDSNSDSNFSREGNRLVDMDEYNRTIQTAVYNIPGQTFENQAPQDIESAKANNCKDDKQQQESEVTYEKNFQDRFVQEYEVPKESAQVSPESVEANCSTTTKQQLERQQTLYKSTFNVQQSSSYVQSRPQMFNNDYRNEERNIYKPRFSMISNSNRVQEQQSYIQEPSTVQQQEFQTLNAAPSTIYKPRFNLLMETNNSNRTTLTFVPQERADFINLRTANTEPQMTYNLSQIHQQNYLQGQQIQPNQYVDLNQDGGNRYVIQYEVPDGDLQKYNRGDVQYKPYQ